MLDDFERKFSETEFAGKQTETIAQRRKALEIATIDLPTKGLAIWFSAEMGIDAGAGQGVETWRSRIGDITATAEEAQKRPQLIQKQGHKLLRFDGTDDMMKFNFDPNNLRGITLIAVCGSRGIVRGRDTTHNLLQWPETAAWGQIGYGPYRNAISIRFGTGQVRNGQTIQRIKMPADEELEVHMAIHNGLKGTDYLYVNGKEVEAITGREQILLNHGTEAWIGAGWHKRSFWPGVVGEILVYKRALSPKEIQEITATLKRKYRIR
jgi:hypothetical protein